MARADRPSAEDLPQPEGQQARTRRLRGQIALGAVGLVVALLIGRGSLTSDGAPQAQHSASTPHPAFPASIPQRRGTDPAACPGQRCSTSHALPASVSDAIRTAFPEAVVEQTETVRLRGGDRVLWYREVDVQVASQRLTLRVQAPAKGDRTGSGHRSVNGQRTTFVSTSLGPWHVEADVVDPLGGVAPTSRLRSLAHDPRIVAR